MRNSKQIYLMISCPFLLIDSPVILYNSNIINHFSILLSILPQFHDLLVKLHVLINELILLTILYGSKPALSHYPRYPEYTYSFSRFQDKIPNNLA